MGARRRPVGKAMSQHAYADLVLDMLFQPVATKSLDKILRDPINIKSLNVHRLKLGLASRNLWLSSPHIAECHRFFLLSARSLFQQIILAHEKSFQAENFLLIKSIFFSAQFIESGFREMEENLINSIPRVNMEELHARMIRLKGYDDTNVGVSQPPIVEPFNSSSIGCSWVPTAIVEGVRNSFGELVFESMMSPITNNKSHAVGDGLDGYDEASQIRTAFRVLQNPKVIDEEITQVVDDEGGRSSSSIPLFSPNDLANEGGLVTESVISSCSNKEGFVDNVSASPIGGGVEELVTTGSTSNRVGMAGKPGSCVSKHGVPDEVTVSGAKVVIPMAVVDDMCLKFTNTLYGYFIGQRIAFPIVEDYVKHAWAKFGFEHVMLRNGFFLFKFSSLEGMTKVLDGGPWFIKSMPIFLHTWVPNTRLEREKITKVPVWVRIHNVPSVVYYKVGISLIAKQLGRIIRFDAGTNDMCKNPWGRYSYARVLIELSADLDVLESIDVAIPLPKGKGHYMEVLDVEYEWWPSWCSKCICFNHDDDVCPLRRKRVTKDSTQKDIEVKRKVHSTKAGQTSDKGKNGAWGVSTKPKLAYQPVSKPATKKKNRGSQPDVGAAIKPTNGDSTSIGTSNDALKIDFGAATVEDGHTQFEQPEPEDAHASFGGVEPVGESGVNVVPLHSTTEGLWDSHNDGASTSVTYSDFDNSSSFTTIVKSPMKRVTFADEDEVYKNYDDFEMYSKFKNGSPKDFQLLLFSMFIWSVAHVVHVSFKNEKLEPTCLCRFGARYAFPTSGNEVPRQDSDVLNPKQSTESFKVWEDVEDQPEPMSFGNFRTSKGSHGINFSEVEMEDIFEEPIVDIDISDAKNLLAVVEYVQDLYTHYRRTESYGMVSPDYMLTQQSETSQETSLHHVEAQLKYLYSLLDLMITFGNGLHSDFMVAHRTVYCSCVHLAKDEA
ncbi:ATPase, F1/V1/A1 complex, alpha/beta subunit, Zinc knuckle CX2CX4HX4C [Artemisia annua]|uniref:ATPase, F1/V1/A1 complex, alpha/beta subunit, Zinc knuckle CX2CX4HX4C n=1 Tax=Artemisia annua TaxID=35608 RepID=A0A2U1NXF3_ARTAN|nr:ATPase, F1/V1/A1 complex, alpha/beta subunit, Zinc knuckle CX2CX4HX4C [Artemisia annua]